MVAGSISRENVSRVSLDRIWKGGVLDSHNLLPKILPDFISSVELSEGDGGPGTLKKIIFTDAVKEFRSIKEKNEVLDSENHIVKHSVIEGGLIGLRLKSYSFELKFEVINNSETLGKLKIEYETIDDTPLNDEEQEEISKSFFLIVKAIDEYLTNNPTAYA
ncbi:major pollen allergen Bet v 1-M/N-like [Phalaenopsis equestris]|uniref:major pollen allergen Bet v 1-M/N-like n=1 Tax=Phalaenopsis equestris TaxID=78828 RepID=UPI0009E421AA|nr:major pollen allergen Bet v 1-M/N-like [Phalaenopsis equestris]